MQNWLFLLFLLFIDNANSSSSSVQVEKNHINYQHGKITVDYQLTLSANAQKVKDLLQKYESFSENSRLVTKSVIYKDNSNNVILQQQLHPCLLGLCYNLSKTQRLLTDQSGYTSAIFTPDQTYFQSGYERWQVSSVNNKTRIHYSANIIPSFKVPALIGNFLIRHFIEDEIHYVAKKIQEKCQ